MELTRAEISDKIQQNYAELRRIELAIQTLPAREMYLIRSRYIDHRSWEQICVDMNYSWRQMHRIHSDALNGLGGEGNS
jgi:DNA-directed RNA polymerase specialized sigma subunit